MAGQTGTMDPKRKSELMRTHVRIDPQLHEPGHENDQDLVGECRVDCMDRGSDGLRLVLKGKATAKVSNAKRYTCG